MPRYPLSRDLVMARTLLGWDLDTIQGTRHVYLGVSDRNLGSGLCAQGSGALLWRCP
jgi:hypothetical protein